MPFAILPLSLLLSRQSPEPKGSESQPTPVTNRELLGSHLTADRLGGSVQVLGVCAVLHGVSVDLFSLFSFCSSRFLETPLFIYWLWASSSLFLLSLPYVSHTSLACSWWLGGDMSVRNCPYCIQAEVLTFSLCMCIVCVYIIISPR